MVERMNENHCCIHLYLHSNVNKIMCRVNELTSAASQLGYHRAVAFSLIYSNNYVLNLFVIILIIVLIV